MDFKNGVRVVQFTNYLTGQKSSPYAAKQCTICGDWLAVESFGKRSGVLRGQCKWCLNRREAKRIAAKKKSEHF